MDPERYAEQTKWKQSVQEKVESKKREEEEALGELTFQPTFETKSSADIKKITGPVADLTIQSGNSYVERQLKARKEKQLKLEKLNGRPTNSRSVKRTSPLSLRASTLSHPNQHKNIGMSLSPSAQNNTGSFDDDEEAEPETHGRELTYEETLVEMLEKERKEWREERVKLIHCIYLQQMELTERAVAAQEKAAEIAKEFGKAIMTFEQRLDTIEGNVEKEIKAVRDIADSLLKAVQVDATDLRKEYSGRTV